MWVFSRDPMNQRDEVWGEMRPTSSRASLDAPKVFEPLAVPAEQGIGFEIRGACVQERRRLARRSNERRSVPVSAAS